MRVETKEQIKDRHLHKLLRLCVKSILTEELSQLSEYIDDNWQWVESFSRDYNAQLDKLYPATIGPR